MSGNKGVNQDLRNNISELERMKECLEEANFNHAGLSLEEIKHTYKAINSSRYASVTVDSDDSDNEKDVVPRSLSSSSDAGSKHWLSKPKSSEQGSNTKFHYKIPKLGTATKIIPLNALNEDSDDFHPVTISSSVTQKLRTIRPTSIRSTDSDNPFAALDNGNPRDFKLIILHPKQRLKKEISAEMAARNAPPPYNDPRYDHLSFKERFEIIGKYMRDQQQYILQFAQATGRKAPWGKPVASSVRFSGTLDKISRGGHLSVIENVDVEMDSNKDIAMEDDAFATLPVSPILFDDPFSTESIERETSEFDADEVCSSPSRLLRKRKATSPTDSLSPLIDPCDDDPDFDFNEAVKKRKRAAPTTRGRGAKAQASSSISHVVDDDDGLDATDAVAAKYATIIHNRPPVAVRGGRGGKGRGAARGAGKGRAKTNADIMARSSLFKDDKSPGGKLAGETGKAGSRSRRLLDLSEAEEARKAEEAITIDKINDSFKVPSTEHDDEEVQISDDDGDFEKAFDMLKRRVPVPLPKARLGVPRLPRQSPLQPERTKINDTSVIDLEQPCPICNVMFKTSIIEEHASNCEGVDSMETVTCHICDKVFLQNTDFEVHSNKCIAIAKNM